MESPGHDISDPRGSSVLLLWPGDCVSQTVHVLTGAYMTVAGVLFTLEMDNLDTCIFVRIHYQTTTIIYH